MSEPDAKKQRVEENHDLVSSVSRDDGEGGETQQQASVSATKPKPLSFEEQMKAAGIDDPFAFFTVMNKFKGEMQAAGFDDAADFFTQMKDLKGTVETLEGTVEKLEGRLDNIANSMDHTTTHTLLETAVYVSIDDSFDKTPDKNVADRVKYGVAQACSLALEVFMTKDPGLLKKKKWSGPGFFKTDRLAVIVQGLHGFFAFVDEASLEDIRRWSPKKRNGLSHNGTQLDCVLTTPDKEGRRKCTSTKERVKGLRLHYEEEGRKVCPFETLKSYDNLVLQQRVKEKLDSVLVALAQKGIEFDDDGERQTALDKVCDFLVRL